jgi:hypothetical protein
LAASTALPKLVAGGEPPVLELDVEPRLGSVVVRRWPTLTSPNWMPVPRAASSSCTSRLGMSTLVGTALPRRTIIAY